MTPGEFYTTVMAVCMMYPASVTGGGRTHERNAAVGGHIRSRHLLWLALDVVPDSRTDDHLIVEEFKRQGLVAVIEDDPYHIHVQVP